MRIRFISDIHAGINTTYSPTNFVDIMHSKKPADVTLIAGDMDADIDEAKAFLNKYFSNERVIFIGGNHITYHENALSFPDILNTYQQEFNGQWKFLENDYVWLNDNIAVIGCIGWTDYKYHSYKLYHKMEDEFGRALDQQGNLLPINPTETPEFKAKVREIWDKNPSDYSIIDKELKALYESVTPKYNERVDTTFKERVSKEVYENYINWLEGKQRQGKYEYSQKDYTDYNKQYALRIMNDFRYGNMKSKTKIFGKYLRPLNPDDCLKFHRQSKQYIKKAYKEITAKNPNATVILMTHHPFTNKCESPEYKGGYLNAAFISNCNTWLKQFKQLKYYHCGHVHSRFFDKLGNIQIVCNPMGYLPYHEETANIPFDINHIIEI